MNTFIWLNVLGPSKRNPSVPEIAFFATISRHDLSNLGEEQVLLFDNVRYNVGNAYNGRHGSFTAPVDGTYVFHVTLACMTFLRDAQYAFLYVNDEAMYGFLLHNPLQSSQMLVYRLRVGDEVLVKNTYVGDAVYGFTWSTFSGFLLYAHSEAAIVG
ncbi:hypothetical protein DPMN_112557 [Dreissena polymorpha]|uniref:C1q domain-containing protein n=1 Tax=Dreissena polymorpha TaxID=45954 RepID=A0A9D4KGK4_DREPO|nr:hypothetical protein DPMN_112557 [Dreissena polymorpha]